MLYEIICYIIICSPLILLLIGMINFCFPRGIKCRRKDYVDCQNEHISIYEWHTSPGLPNRYKVPYERTKKISEFPTITFQQFKDFYNLNPDSWTLKRCRVYKNDDNELSFTFTYDEWKKYVKFKAQIEKQKEEQRLAKEEIDRRKQQNKITVKILEEVQKDIDHIRAQSIKNFNEVSTFIQGVEL